MFHLRAPGHSGKVNLQVRSGSLGQVSDTVWSGLKFEWHRAWRKIKGIRWLCRHFQGVVCVCFTLPSWVLHDICCLRFHFTQNSGLQKIYVLWETAKFNLDSKCSFLVTHYGSLKKTNAAKFRWIISHQDITELSCWFRMVTQLSLLLCVRERGGERRGEAREGMGAVGGRWFDRTEGAWCTSVLFMLLHSSFCWPLWPHCDLCLLIYWRAGSRVVRASLLGSIPVWGSEFSAS